MFDCLAACNNVCITCIWCMLLSTCYPKILGASENNSRKCRGLNIPGSDAKIPSLLEYGLGSAEDKISPTTDDPNCRRITIPRPPSKETI